MSETNLSNDSHKKNRNSKIFFICAFLVIAMLGLAYASVPLYRLFCQVTGFSGTTQRVDEMPDISVLERKISVRFDANTDSNLPWEFKPLQRQVSVQLGEKIQVAYYVKNLADYPVTGSATFNVTPLQAGGYFNKIECFCFTETTLQPGEAMDMPVLFFIDPELSLDDELARLGTITLSYTFYRIKDPEDRPNANKNNIQVKKHEKDHSHGEGHSHEEGHNHKHEKWNIHEDGHKEI